MKSYACVSLSSRAALTIVLSGAAVMIGACKKEKASCSPDSVDWKLQLALQSSEIINPTDSGDSLPTALRIFQLRGELAIDSLEFEQVWAVEEASELGESFLSMEELTLFADQNEVRRLPVQSEATHVVAAGLFREPASTSWFTSYEIPVQHPKVVCAKDPVRKVYPDPCFYVLLDRNVLDGGATPPSGYVTSADLKCAPLGVSVGPESDEQSDRKKKRQERRKRMKDRRQGIENKPDELQKQLDGKRPEVPEGLGERPQLPDAPQLPDPSVPRP